MKIQLAAEDDLDQFFDYFRNQLSENGSGGLYFQPTSCKDTILSEATIEKTKKGIELDIGPLGWRRLWLAKSMSGEILGHADIRPRSENHARHRVLLGIGVNLANRRQGIGKSLIEYVISYCISKSQIEWLDLFVLSSNRAAIELYKSTGFETIGIIEDMYRVDGYSLSDIFMTMSTKKVYQH